MREEHSHILILSAPTRRRMGVKMRFLPNQKNVRILGRTLTINDVLYLGYSGSAIEFQCKASKVEVVITSEYRDGNDIFKPWLAVVINNQENLHKRFSPMPGQNTYLLYEGDLTETVTVRLLKMSEAAFDKIGIKEILIEGMEPIIPTVISNRKIEFIGDSITCGYGIEGKADIDVFNTTQENPWEAYAAMTARRLKADYHLVSWSGIGIISSYTEEEVPLEDPLMPDLYQYTDKALEQAIGKNSFTKWNYAGFVPECIVINLGTNDQSYTKGVPERIEAFKNGYKLFLKQVRTNNPDSVIVCTLGVMGQELCKTIGSVVEELKEEGDPLVFAYTFPLQLDEDGIGADGHPSLLTHLKMAEKLTDILQKIMNW